MTQHQPRSGHRHVGPDGPLPDDLTNAIARLDELLADLPDPLDDAWDHVTPEQLLAALKNLPSAQTTRMLSLLQAPAPRRPGLPACRKVLQRVHTSPQTAQGVACEITQPIRHELPNVYWEDGSLDDLLTETAEPLIRLALVHDLEDGLTLGAAVHQLLASDLAPVAWEERREELLEAAESAQRAVNDLLSTGPEADVTDQTEDTGQLEESAAHSKDGAPEYDTLIEQAETTIQAAREACRRTGAALDAGTAPDSADLEAVNRVRPALQAAATALTAILADEGADGTVEPALPAIQAAQERLGQLRRPEILAARRLLGLGGPPEVAGEVEGLRALASGLVARAGSWNEDDHAAVEFMTSLARLIDAVGENAPPPRKLELHTAAGAAAPGGAYDNLLLHASLGMLTLLASEAPPTAQPAEETLQPDPETASTEAEAPSVTRSPSTPDPTAPLTSEDPSAHLAAPAAEAAPQQPSPEEPVTVTATAATPTLDDDERSAGTDTAAAQPTPSAPTSTGAQPTPVETASAPRAAESATVLVPPDAATPTEETLGGLLSERRFALAYWLASAAGLQEERCWFLRYCAYVQAVRTAHGACAAELQTQLNDLKDASTGYLLGAQQLHPLALTVAIRACLTAPHSGVNGHVPGLARSVPDLPNLATIAEAAKLTAERGVALADLLLDPQENLAELQATLGRLATDADSFLRDRTLKFHRGSLLWKAWSDRGGLLHNLLAPVMDNDAARIDEVMQQVDTLGARNVIERELRNDDRALRGSSGKAIEGSAKRFLIDRANEARDLARQWVKTTRRLERARELGEPGWVKEPLAALRRVITEHQDAALAELAARQTATDPLARGAAVGAKALLEETFELAIADRPLTGHEGPVEFVLGRDLLGSDVPLTAELRPRDGATLRIDAVSVAATRTLEAGFEARIRRDQYGTAGTIVEMLERERPDGARSFRDELEQARSASVRRIGARIQELERGIRSAQRNGDVTDVTAADLSGRLQEVGRRLEPLTEPNMDVLCGELEDVAKGLEGHRTEARETIEQTLAQLQGNGTVTAELAARVERLLADGDLATAEEFLVLARDGGTPGSASRAKPVAGVREFFPKVPDALPDGIDERLVEAVRRHEKFGPLDFRELLQDAVDTRVDALSRWREAARPQHRKDWLPLLAPVLRLCGIEARGERQVLRGGSRWTWVDLTGVSIPGEAPVSKYGSELGGRLRLLLCWRPPSEALLLDWAKEDASGSAVIVLHFGTMSAAARRRLAAEYRRRHLKRPLLVVDDAAVAFAAAVGGGRIDEVLHAVLPFTAANPYVPDAQGNIPPEMFYGRDREIHAITDPGGTSLLFGGRQLGKSALLREVARRFERAQSNVAIYLDIKQRVGEPTLWQHPERIWTVLWDGLVEKGIAGKGARRGDPVKAVPEAVMSWLGADETRRVVLLLDECDAYFDGDSGKHFENTDRLKYLRDETNRRCKPVFAGLHTVQRFAMSPNQPLAHLGRPTPIGPLSPQAAYDLISEPLRVLGLEPDSEDLVNRILAYCNYQPVLLQLFGDALVEHCLAAEVPTSFPKWIDQDTIERVAESGDLIGRIREKFDLTLGLDPRYKLIAYATAEATHAKGADRPLTAHELRQACDNWWADGFTGLAPDAFRALLDEMVGLGVLARAPSGRYRLRSPNMLRLLGDREEVESVLLQAEQFPPPRTGILTERRWRLEDGSYSPVSEQQLADLVGEHKNQIRLVIGSAATGVDRVLPALENAEAGFKLIKPRKRSYYEQALRESREGGHRVIVSLLSGGDDRDEVHPDTCATALEQACTITPRRGATRSVVLVTDPRNLEWWLDLLATPGALPEMAELVELRRYGDRALWAWTVDTDGTFQDATARQRLLEVTGGWPLLIDQAARLVAKRAGRETVLTTIREDLATREGASRLVEAVGVDRPPLADIWDKIVEFSDLNIDVEELAEVLDNPAVSQRARAGVEVLCALQALVREPDGTLRPEPVLAEAWKRVRG